MKGMQGKKHYLSMKNLTIYDIWYSDYVDLNIHSKLNAS